MATDRTCEICKYNLFKRMIDEKSMFSCPACGHTFFEYPDIEMPKEKPREEQTGV